jgi:hypothetical protein
MRLKCLCMTIAVPLLFAAGQATAGTVPAPAGALPTTLRVLVGVDSHGKVVKASPATAVSPSVERALVRTLDRMITHPARDASGKAIPSGFVMRLAPHAIRTADGKYQLAFDHLSTKALPSGSWVWCGTPSVPTHLVNLSVPGAACHARPRSYLWGPHDSLILNPRGTNIQVSSPGRAQRQ